MKLAPLDGVFIYGCAGVPPLVSIVTKTSDPVIKLVFEIRIFPPAVQVNVPRRAEDTVAVFPDIFPEPSITATIVPAPFPKLVPPVPLPLSLLRKTDDVPP